MIMFTVFKRKYPSWANLVQKFGKVKFETKVNSNIQNSKVVSILSVLD